MHMSNYLETALINGTLRNIQYTVPSTVYLALYTSNPTEAGTGTETTYGGYARQEVTFSAPTNGVTSNSADIIFPGVASGTPTITHVGIRDALTGGNLLYYSSLSSPKSLTIGKQFIITAGQLTVTLA
jgi:hypothetical protein